VIGAIGSIQLNAQLRGLIRLVLEVARERHAAVGACAFFGRCMGVFDPQPAGIGENLLPIHFTYTVTSDTTINGYNFYCDPAPGVDAAADAGVLPIDGGVVITSCAGVPSNNLPQPRANRVSPTKAMASLAS